MARNRVQITGDKTLQRRLRKLEKNVQGQVLLAGAIAGADVIRDEASARAPRETGRLAAGIDLNVSVTKQRKAVVDVGYPRNVFYGTFQELGTSHHPAQPHLRPAIDSAKNRAVKRAGDVLRLAVNAARRG